jgi:hypothetical protein
VGLTTLPCKNKIVEKPQRNSAGFCGGGQGLSWVVEPRKEEVVNLKQVYETKFSTFVFRDMEQTPSWEPNSHSVKKLPAVYETHRFITAFTRACHWSLS